MKALLIPLVLAGALAISPAPARAFSLDVNVRDSYRATEHRYARDHVALRRLNDQARDCHSRPVSRVPYRRYVPPRVNHVVPWRWNARRAPFARFHR